MHTDHVMCTPPKKWHHHKRQPRSSSSHLGHRHHNYQHNYHHNHHVNEHCHVTAHNNNNNNNIIKFLRYVFFLLFLFYFTNSDGYGLDSAMLSDYFAFSSCERPTTHSLLWINRQQVILRSCGSVGFWVTWANTCGVTQGVHTRRTAMPHERTKDEVSESRCYESYEWHWSTQALLASRNGCLAIVRGIAHLHWLASSNTHSLDLVIQLTRWTVDLDTRRLSGWPLRWRYNVAYQGCARRTGPRPHAICFVWEVCI